MLGHIFVWALIWAFAICPAAAQSPQVRATVLFRAPAATAAAPAFTGTGDVVSGFNAWVSCGVGYSAAYAAPGTNPACKVCDGATASCITLNVPTNGIVSAPGATACGGNPCTTVDEAFDQSGANYCSGSPCHFIAASAATRPQLLTNCGTGTMLCMNLTTSGLHLDGPTLPSISQPYTVSGVVKTTSANIAQVEILSIACNNLYGGSNDGISSSTFDMQTSNNFNNTTTLLTNNTTYAQTGVYNGISSVSSVNGTQTTGNAGTTAWTGGITQLGFVGCFSATKWQGVVSEIGIKGAGFTGTQITNVTAQQRSNWGF